jgi:hypothetical protein
MSKKMSDSQDSEHAVSDGVGEHSSDQPSPGDDDHSGAGLDSVLVNEELSAHRRLLQMPEVQGAKINSVSKSLPPNCSPLL